MNRNTKPQPVDFYFDYLSPFAYFAWLNVKDFCAEHAAELRPRPVVFGKLLDHWGQLGPAEIGPKREWLYKFCYRYAAARGIVFAPPPRHPFRPLAALRLSLPEVCGARQRQVIDVIFDAVWGRGRDGGDPETLAAALSEAGFEARPMLARIQTPEVKNALAESTRRALARGVFGVPTMIVGEELFWGNDQFEDMRRFVRGNDPIDHERLREVLQRPRADRPAKARA